MLLKDIKVITAFSACCLLHKAFKQFCCISIIAGEKRAVACFFSQQYSICTNNKQLCFWVSRWKKIDLSFTIISNCSFIFHIYLNECCQIRHVPFRLTLTVANTIAKPGLNRRAISWTVVKHLLFLVKVSGSPLGYLPGNYTHWSDSMGCVLGADCASLRLLVNTNPLPHSPNCEWQSILWKAVSHKPAIGFALDFENCQSGPRGIRREVDLTLPINVKGRSEPRRVPEFE